MDDYQQATDIAREQGGLYAIPGAQREHRDDHQAKQLAYERELRASEQARAGQQIAMAARLEALRLANAGHATEPAEHIVARAAVFAAFLETGGAGVMPANPTSTGDGA